MNKPTLFEAFLMVLQDPRTIITIVVVVFFLRFVVFVEKYKKKPPVARKKKVVETKAPDPAAEATEKDEASVE